MTRKSGAKEAKMVVKAAMPSAIALDRKELEAFRVRLPTYRRYETYRLMAVAWDIVRALFLVHTYPRDPQPIDVERFAHAYGFPFVPEGESSGELPRESGWFYVDTRAVMSDQVDLERPVLLALIAEESGERPGAVLIDGLHRLFKAAQLGRKTLQAYILTPEEEQVCRI